MKAFIGLLMCDDDDDDDFSVDMLTVLKEWMDKHCFQSLCLIDYIIRAGMVPLCAQHRTFCLNALTSIIFLFYLFGFVCFNNVYFTRDVLLLCCQMA